MTPEGKVKSRAHAILDQFGAYHLMPVAGGYGRAGVFDEVVCYRGWFIGIEYKAKGGMKPTPLQRKNAERAAQAGSIVLLLHANNLWLLERALTVIDLGHVDKVSERAALAVELSNWHDFGTPECYVILDELGDLP
jgi:hypothetical protein